ncbi:MAG: methionyl-tRNA formyltransferase [bacterium]|nr:methionyl-tRNA formyltransferase [bacterium]
MKFVFFGTRELGAQVLESLFQSGNSPTLVVTGVDKPAGRKQELLPSPVKVIAQKHHFPLAQPEKPAELILRKELLGAEFFVVAAYGSILSKEILEIPPKGVLNVHPSLLPKYRGPSPERFTLLAGEKKTGVSVILLDEKVDHGPILAQEEFIMKEGIKHEELHLQLGELGGKLLVKTIPLWREGKITPREQDHEKATFTTKITKEQGKIDWNREAEYIVRQMHAFDPWPGTYASWQGKNIKILEGKASEAFGNSVPGSIISHESGFAVVCGKGMLVVEKLQMEGKNPTLARDFLLGHKDFIGTILA